MKARITEMGELEIIPENETEQYALKKFREEAAVISDDLVRCETFHWRGSKVVIKPRQRESLANDQ